jgi:hypothetical protein
MKNKNKKALRKQRASLNNLEPNDSTNNESSSIRKPAKFTRVEYDILDQNSEIVCRVRVLCTGKKTFKPVKFQGTEFSPDFILMSAQYLSFLCDDKPKQLQTLKDINGRCLPYNGIRPYYDFIASRLFGSNPTDSAYLGELRDYFVSSIIKPTGEAIDD